MDDNVKETLLKKLKVKLRITWNNQKTNEELSDLIDDAEQYMNHLLGAELDYSAPGIMRTLFLNYASYRWNNCEEDFENAYRKEIIKAQAICEVKSHEEKNKSE